MRIVHLSDTHLGFSAYSRIDAAEGINQREADFYSSFRQAVDKAIELDPDVVVHAGDLFDTVRPQNRAIDFALRQLLRLSDAGIETVLISGNHSTPRMRETGSIFRIFEHIAHIHPVHEPGIARVTVGDLTVHAIPHSTSPSIAELAAKARPSKDTEHNVLVLHASIGNSHKFSMDEFNEQAVAEEDVSDEFDYVALGHFHEAHEIRPRMRYCGSTERLSFSEARQNKGIIEFDLTTGKAEFHILKTREMLDLEPIDASNLASSEILLAARDLISSKEIDDRIVRMTITKVAPEAYRSLDIPSIRRLGLSAMHFELKIDRIDAEGLVTTGDVHIGSLLEEFRSYVSSLSMPEEKKRRLLETGSPYFVRGEE